MMPEAVPLPDPTPAQHSLAAWVRRQMNNLCTDAIMAGHATAADAAAVLARWRHHPTCSSWRGGPCDMGCRPQ